MFERRQLILVTGEHCTSDLRGKAGWGTVLDVLLCNGVNLLTVTPTAILNTFVRYQCPSIPISRMVKNPRGIAAPLC